MSEFRQSRSLIEPAGRAIVEVSSNPPQLLELRSPGRRNTVEPAVETAKRDVVEEQLTAPGGPSGEVDVRIVRPVGPCRECRTIVYNVDRADWAGTDAVTHGRLVCELAIGANAAVAFPASCLSPDRPQPTVVEDRYAVARWAAGRGQVVGIDGSRLARATDRARAIDAIRADLNGHSDPASSVLGSRDGSLLDDPRAA